MRWLKYAVPTYLQGIHAKTPILWMPGATRSTQPLPTVFFPLWTWLRWCSVALKLIIKVTWMRPVVVWMRMPHPHKLIYLNAWSLGSGTAWRLRRIERCGLVGEPSVFVSPSVGLNVQLPTTAPAPYNCHALCHEDNGLNLWNWKQAPN